MYLISILLYRYYHTIAYMPYCLYVYVVCKRANAINAQYVRVRKLREVKESLPLHAYKVHTDRICADNIAHASHAFAVWRHARFLRSCVVSVVVVVAATVDVVGTVAMATMATMAARWAAAA